MPTDIIQRFVDQHCEIEGWTRSLDEKVASGAILISPFVTVVTYSVRGKMARQSSPEPARRRNRLFVPIASVAAILAVVVFYVMRTAVGSSASAMIDHEFIVKCLPMRTAQDIAQTLLRSEGNEIQMSLGSRVLRVRATEGQMRLLQAKLDATAKVLPSCDNTPAR